MTLKLIELVAADVALRNLGQPIQSIVDGKKVSVPQLVPPKIAYAVSRLRADVAAHVEPFHAQRNALLERLGTRRPPTDDERAAGTIQDVFELGDKAEEFQRLVKELGDTPVSIDKWLLTFEQLEAYRVSTPDMAALLPLIIEPATESAEPAAKAGE